MTDNRVSECERSATEETVNLSEKFSVVGKRTFGNIFRDIRSPPSKYEVSIQYPKRIIKANEHNISKHNFAGYRIDG